MSKFLTKAQRVMTSKKGEGYVDTMVKVIIAVVIGALVLGGLYLLINTIAMPTAKTKVSSLFDYSPAA